MGGHVRRARQQPRMAADPGLLRSHRCVIVYDLQLYCIHGSPVRPRARGRRGDEARRRSRWARAAEMDLRRAGMVGTDSPPRGCEDILPEWWPARQLVTGASRSASPPFKPLGPRSGRYAMPHPSTTSILTGEARTTGWLRLGYGEASVGGSLRALREGGQAPSGRGMPPSRTTGTWASALADPEKLDAGGVVRGTGGGRSAGPDREVPPLTPYRVARSSRRRRVNGSALSAMSRTRSARAR